ncbi:transcription factor NF-E2 45 kDa subunit [Pelobates fuscus]|uniref:transcription factor NF-E2 45 kDa subunit n=1 Tax=Pelobates fuscus TaxID=191477 RepID=UPI002FE4F5A1
MSPCPPRVKNGNTFFPNLMGDQSVQGDMDLAWQEILSITDLQGLDVQTDPVYDTSGYGPQTHNISFSGYGVCHLPDGIVTSLSHTQNYDRPYMDTVTMEQQHLPSLPLAPTFGPTAYTGMLISSSLTQVDANAHYPPKNVPVGGLFNTPAMGMAMTYVQSLNQVCKGQDDIESDSGLSLNFSDGESTELDHMEPQRLQSEYLDMIPPLAYQDQYGLMPTVSQPFINHISETCSYDTSQTQELVCSRDERRAAAMNIPFPTERIVNLPVEDFNELLSRFTLTEPQLALVKDIRRRGKNKVAAQNCRKRKMETIAILEKEIWQLRTEREGLRREREEVGRIMGDLKKNLELLEQQVVSVLQDQEDHLCPVDDFLLKQAYESNLFPAPLSKETRA